MCVNGNWHTQESFSVPTCVVSIYYWMKLEQKMHVFVYIDIKKYIDINKCQGKNHTLKILCTFQYVEQQLECNKSADLISEILKCVSKHLHHLSVSCSSTFLKWKKCLHKWVKYLSCVRQTCLHSLCQKFPPSVQFRRTFLTELIRRVGGLSFICLSVSKKSLPSLLWKKPKGSRSACY